MRISGVASAVPAHRYRQDAVTATLNRLWNGKLKSPELLERLRTAAASGRPVQLGFIDERSDVIEDVVA